MTQSINTHSSPVEDDDLFFDDLIKSYVESNRFVQRHWLLKKIEQHLSDPDCRIILLTAEPGAGKTAFMAWLANQHADWPRYFIRKDSKEQLRAGDAQSFLLTVGHQLALIHPSIFKPDKLKVAVSQKLGKVTSTGSAVGILVDKLHVSPFYQTSLSVRQDVKTLAGGLTGISIKKLVSESRLLTNEKLQQLGLFGPAQVLLKEKPSAKVIILIDALDELRFHDIVDDILKWLSGLGIAEIPSNIRFIISSRPLKEDTLNIFRERYSKSLREEAINPYSKDVQGDLDSYSRYFVSQNSIKQIFDSYKIDSSKFVEQSVTKAEGNFQYLAFLYRGIEQKIIQAKEKKKMIGSTVAEEEQELVKLITFKDVPTGLRSLYDFFLDQLKASVSDKSVVEIPGEGLYGESVYIREWEGLYRPILGVMAVAMQPLDPFQIRNFTGFKGDEGLLKEALDRLGQFLDHHKEMKGDTYTYYHSTFAESITTSSTETIDSNNNAYKTRHYLNPSDWHRKIVGYYHGAAEKWENVNWENVDDYGLQKLALHLYALRDVKTDNSKYSYLEEFYNIICKPYMKKKLTKYGSFGSFAADLELAIQSAQSEKYRNLVQLIRGVLINTTLQMIATKVPPQILATLVLLGEDRRAIGFTPLMAKESRIEADLLMGTALAQRGEITQARDILLRVLDENLESMRSGEKGSSYSLTRLSSSLAMIGELDHLLTQPEIISPTDKSSRDPLLEQITQRLTSTGQIEKALEVSAKIEDKLYKALALCGIAKSFLSIGEKAKAKDIVNQAQQYAESIEDPMGRTYALKEVVKRLIQIEENDRAIRMIDQLNALSETINNKTDKANVLSVLAYLLAYAQKNKRMLKVSEQVIGLLKEINDDDKNEKAKKNALQNLLYLDLLTMVRELKKGLTMEPHNDRDHSDALLVQIAYALRGYGWKPPILNREEDGSMVWGEGAIEVALHLYEIGKIEEALSIAEVTNDKFVKSIILHQIAESLFFEKKKNLALNLSNRMHAIAETITVDSNSKDRALTAVALTLAIADEYASAEEMANKVVPLLKMQKLPIEISSESEALKDKDNKDRAIAAIATALADSGNPVKALELVDKIKYGSWRVDIKFAVVRGLAKTNQRARAREIANNLLSIKIVNDPGSMKEGSGITPQEQIMALTWAGEVRQALEIVKDWKLVGLRKADVVSDMALALFVIGEKAESTKLANMALKVILMMTDMKISYKDKDYAPKKGLVLTKVAQALATTNQFSEAIKLMDSIEDTVLKLLNYGYVASCLVAVGKEPDARKIADKALALMNEPTSHEVDPASRSQYAIDSLASIVAGTVIMIANSERRSSAGADAVILATATSRLPKWRGWRQQTEELEDNMLNQLIREGEATIDGKKIKAGGLMSMETLVLSLASPYSLIGDHERALSLWIRLLMWFHASDSLTIIEDERNWAELFGDGSVVPSKRTSLFGILAAGAPLIANIDQGQTLWKIYEAITEVESWWEA